MWEQVFPGSSAGKESTCNAGDPGSIPGLRRFPGEGIGHPLQCSWAFPVAQTVKNLPSVWETWVGKMPWRRALHYSFLENPHGQGGLVGYSSWGSQRVKDGWATKHSAADLGCHFSKMPPAPGCFWYNDKLLLSDLDKFYLKWSDLIM